MREYFVSLLELLGKSGQCQYGCEHSSHGEHPEHSKHSEHGEHAAIKGLFKSDKRIENIKEGHFN